MENAKRPTREAISATMGPFGFKPDAKVAVENLLFAEQSLQILEEATEVRIYKERGLWQWYVAVD